MADLNEAFTPPIPKPGSKPRPRPGSKPRPRPRPRPGSKPRPKPRPGSRPRPRPRRRPWNWPWERRNVLVDRRVTNVYPTYGYDDSNDYVTERPIYENPQLWIILAFIAIIIAIWASMRRRR
jgi:hypothetical protein